MRGARRVGMEYSNARRARRILVFLEYLVGMWGFIFVE